MTHLRGTCGRSVVANSTPEVNHGAAVVRGWFCTVTTPVVMATSADAVGDGLIASFARPGGNVTGISLFSRELSGKRLEVVKEAIPGITRVAVLFNTLNPSNPPQFRETEQNGYPFKTRNAVQRLRRAARRRRAREMRRVRQGTAAASR
jgi:ABC transporter substrate binding protein